MEIETNVRRWEALLRELFAKRDALLKAGEARAVHIVLVLPATRHHRELIGALAASVRSALPVTSRELRRALVDGGRWPGDGILWLGGGRGRAGEAA